VRNVLDGCRAAALLSGDFVQGFVADREVSRGQAAQDTDAAAAVQPVEALPWVVHVPELLHRRDEGRVDSAGLVAQGCPELATQAASKAPLCGAGGDGEDDAGALVARLDCCVPAQWA
jgi:hypothetical protein